MNPTARLTCERYGVAKRIGIGADTADVQRRIGDKDRADVMFFRERTGLFPTDSCGDRQSRRSLIGILGEESVVMQECVGWKEERCIRFRRNAKHE